MQLHDESVTTSDEIKYVAAPTAIRFHKDNTSLVRVILGPVGGGKTVACLMEILGKAFTQEPFRGIRQSRWAIIRACYDEETEILTGERGWQYFKDLLPEDSVATLVNGKVIYQVPEKLYVAPYKGDMIGFEGEGINFLVTPDHKMYVKKHWNQRGTTGYFDDYHEESAENIYGTTQFHVKRNADWIGYETGHSLDEYEWLGYWFAEGSLQITPRRRCVITTLNDIGYCRDLFNRAGITYFESNRVGGGINFVCHETSPIYRNLVPFIEGKSNTKCIPVAIKNAPPEFLRKFLRGFTQGDGSVRDGGTGTVTLYTSSKQLADDLQEIALKAGHVANISERDRRGKQVKIGDSLGIVNHKEYIVTLLKPNKYEPKLYCNPKTTSRLRGWYKQPYEGNVYCVEMPLVPVYVRRKGKGFWCYRTYPELKNTTLKTFQAWVPDRMCHVNMQPPYTGMLRQKLDDGTTVECEIIFLALDQPDDVKKLKSIEFTGIFINEVRYCDETIFLTCKERLSRYPAMKPDEGFDGPTWYGIIADTNAWPTTHWLYEMFDKGETPPKHKLYEQPPAIYWEKDEKAKGGGRWLVNPDAENLRYLKPDYYQNQIVGGKDDLLRVELGLERGISRQGKPVFPNFSERLHVSPMPLVARRGLPMVLGFDWGLHPGCVFAQLHPGGFIHLLECLAPADESLEEFADNYVIPLLNKKYQGYRIIGVGDPSGGRSKLVKATPYSILGERGISCKPTTTNVFKIRKEAVDWFLDRHKLLIDPSLTALREGFAGGYHYAEIQNNKGMFKEEPMKNAYSHPMDALQYICLYVKYGFKAPSSSEKKQEKVFKYA